MERNTMTIAGALQPGDRFYKLNDRTKTALQVVHENFKAAETVYCVSAALADRMLEAALTRYIIRINTETEVVFLRNVFVNS